MQFSKGAHYSPGGALSLLGSRKSGALKERITLIASRRRSNGFLTGLGSLSSIGLIHAGKSSLLRLRFRAR